MLGQTVNKHTVRILPVMMSSTHLQGLKNTNNKTQNANKAVGDINIVVCVCYRNSRICGGKMMK